jgi:hypothetical protein
LYADTLGIPPADGGGGSNYARDGMLGIMNASPFFAAALLGAPLSLPANYYIGRRGALVVSAMLIIVSSLGSSFSRTWVQLLGVRIVGGVGKSSSWKRLRAGHGADRHRNGHQGHQRADSGVRVFIRLLERLHHAHMATMVIIFQQVIFAGNRY